MMVKTRQVPVDCADLYPGINVVIDDVSVQAKHTQDNSVCWGVDGETGCLSDMSALGIWEPLAVKAQTYKTAVEVREHTPDH